MAAEDTVLFRAILYVILVIFLEKSIFELDNIINLCYAYICVKCRRKNTPETAVSHGGYEKAAKRIARIRSTKKRKVRNWKTIRSIG